MQRENFYLLLELPVDPPEEDIKKIEAAIKKKQALWSRVRNHPTKGLKAQRYIGLIPEIKKVMSDPELRKKEAGAALNQINKKKQVKFINVDRHLMILMSKGDVTDEEVARLAEFHQLGVDKIKERLNARKKVYQLDRDIDALLARGEIKEKAVDKIAKNLQVSSEQILEFIKKKKTNELREIDTYLKINMRKGYIGEDEIVALARLYAINQNEITAIVKCPVWKGAGDNADFLQNLDPTIEKLIVENLKVVGKKSLYQFLELPPSSDLKTLQDKAKEKEIAIRKITQKDAITTASGVLAGHCIAIFKDEKNRMAYDRSRTRVNLNLSNLNGDIQIAAMNGTIPAAYLKILLRTAVKSGMNPDDAREYISSYCAREGWQIETATVKKKPGKRLILAVAAAVVLLVCIVGGIFAYRYYSAKSEYRQLIENVQNEASLETRLEMLQAFINTNDRNKYTDDVSRRIRVLRNQIEEKNFKDTVNQAESLIAENKIEQAMALYTQFIEKHRYSKHKSTIEKKMAGISGALDDNVFMAMKDIPETDYSARIQAYNSYIENYPRGRHVAEVDKMITQATEAFLQDLSKKFEDCEKKRDWRSCIQRCDELISQTTDRDLVYEIKGLKSKYQAKLEYQSEIDDVKRQADERGEDYVSAKQMFLDYMQINPELPSDIRDLVVKEIAELDRKIEIQRQKQEEWEKLLAYSQNAKIKLDSRIKALDKYIDTNKEDSPYTEEAKRILGQLKKEKGVLDDKMRAKQEIEEWNRIVAYCQNPKISANNRFQAIVKYVRDNPSVQWINDARRLFEKVSGEKQLEDQRIANQKNMVARKKKERAVVLSGIKRAGGRFAYNGNDTITDKTTGLTWCLYDSAIILGGCLDYKSSADYVKTLNTGGYRDWRIPTPQELIGIYKTQPFFPASSTQWYWTSDVLWHGWNKTAQVVTTKPETVWNKSQMSINECGAVRPVRP